MPRTPSPAATAEFHALAGHPGPAAGCAACAAQDRRQQDDERALRRHRAHTAERMAAL